MGTTITFYEAEPFYDDAYTLFPVFMKKDGKSYFVYNHREGETEKQLLKDDMLKEQLIQNGGVYGTYKGYYRNPLDMLREMIGRKQHFTRPEKIFENVFEKQGYGNFSGSRAEASADVADFYYRFYDIDVYDSLKQLVINILNENWQKAIEELVTVDKKIKELSVDSIAS